MRYTWGIGPNEKKVAAAALYKLQPQKKVSLSGHNNYKAHKEEKKASVNASYNPHRAEKNASDKEQM